jgi:hypothetical protein
MTRPWWWWCAAATVALSVTRAVSSSVAPVFRVRNLSRRSEVLKRNDVVEVSCLQCLEGGAPVVTWRVSSSAGARVVSQGNESLVAAFDSAGLVGVEAVVRPNGVDDVALPLVLTLEESNGVCFVWHSCFALADTDDCVASWDAFAVPRAVLALRVWAGYAAEPSLPLSGAAPTGPAAQDALLSAELYALGEQPTVTLPVQPFESSLGPPVQVERLGAGQWQVERSLWLFNIHPAWSAPLLFGGRTLELLLTGLSVSVLGCATPQSQRLLLDLTSLYVPAPPQAQVQAPRAGADRALRFDMCSCALFSAASDPRFLLYSQEVGGLWGRGARRAELALYAPSSGAALVLDFSPSRQGLLVLSSSGLFRLPSLASNATNSSQWSEQALALGGPVGSATRLATAAGCDRLLDSADRTRNDVVAAWDGNSSGVTSVLLSQDGGATWGAPLAISREPRFASGFTVREAMPLASAPRVVVVASEGGRDHVFLLDEHSGESTLAATFGGSDVSLPALGPSLGLGGPLLQSGEILLWGAGGLFYSTSTGLTWRAVALARFDLAAGAFAPVALALGDAVVSVATSAAGDLAVLTRAGRVFETKLGLSTAYELYSPLRQPAAAPWPPAALRYYGSELAAVQAAAGAQAQAVELFPVLRRQYATGEARNATLLGADSLVALAAAGGLLRPFDCPFLAWTREEPRDTYYADMNDRLEATVRLTHPARAEGLHISFQTSSRTYLDMVPQPEVVSSNEDGSIVVRERTVVLAVPPNATARKGLGQRERAAGKVIVRASPTLYTPGCGSSASLIEISVGCPRGRHLRYRAPDAYAMPSLSVVSAECAVAPDVTGCICDKYRGRQYQLASALVDRPRMASYYATRGRKKGYVGGLEDPSAATLEYPYDYDTFGCPTFVPYSAQFKPIFEIWDFDTLVKTVSAEFVLAEVHGRRELSYGETAGQAGCATPPDTWAAKLAKEADFAKAWGSHNYRPCVQRNASTPNNTEPWAALPFEVLSPASPNYIGFAKNSSTVPFLFYAFIVDPDYSFCPLATAFSVEVYGMPLASWTTYLIVLCVVSLSLLLLAFTYVVHRREILQAAANDALRDNMGEGAKLKAQ